MGLLKEMEADRWLDSLPIDQQKFVTDAIVACEKKHPKPSELKILVEQRIRDWKE